VGRKVKHFTYIEELEITGLFDGGRNRGAGYDHGVIGRWAFSKSSDRQSSSSSLPDRLLPSLRQIEIHALDTGCRQPALKLDFRRHAISAENTTFEGWDLCLRVHSTLSLLDTPEPGLLRIWFCNVGYLKLHDFAFHSYCPSIFQAPLASPKGTVRYYVGESTGPAGLGALASGSDADPAINAWSSLYSRTPFTEYRIRIFGAFRHQASESDEQSVRDATIAELTRYGGKHRREVADAPLADQKGDLWYAPSGYMEGCMCGEAGRVGSDVSPVVSLRDLS
jgi:hypothetical protein